MLTQGATCSARLAMKSTSPQIPGCADFEIPAHRETRNHHQQNSSDGSFVDVASVDSDILSPQKPLLDCYGKLSSHKDCNPTCVEAEGNQAVEECGFGMQVKQDEAFDISCGEHQKEECETTRVDDENRTAKVHAIVNCSSQMDKLSVNVRETHIFHEGQGEGQEELNPLNKGIQSVSPPIQTVSNGLDDDVSNLSNEKESEEQSLITPPPRKLAAWRTPEPKDKVFPESDFIMEASSWPTLAEARHAKPSEARISPSHKETISVSPPAQKVPSSQESSVEAPKHLNTNPLQPVSKYRSSYKKGSVSSYGKPSFPATENIPIPPMGVHVPSANTFNLDESRKGNGVGGMNNFFPGPHQAPANGPFYPHRGEGLAPFPHNSVPPYGRGHPGWQHHGRGYSDASYKHSGFLPRYDQQHIGPRNVHPPMVPFMNINVAQYNYPNFSGDMSYMPAAFSPGYNYAPPYFGSSGPPGGIMQGFDFQTLLAMLQSQIEYYFSKENLIRDIFLTSKMDEEGFVPVSLIASFPRVRNLTLNSMHILEALKNSSIVEVKNGKLRSHEWRRRLSGTSQTHGIESLESCAPLSNTGVDNARTGESEEFGEGKMSTLPESRLSAGSYTAPWTGLSANLGAINVPAVTSIDSR